MRETLDHHHHHHIHQPPQTVDAPEVLPLPTLPQSESTRLRITCGSPPVATPVLHIHSDAARRLAGGTVGPPTHSHGCCCWRKRRETSGDSNASISLPSGARRPTTGVDR
uniref:Uncharacterized protein n=1 Tax=Anopheles maculatus TaxID=74869 RepID=A0A182T538_9DIPT